MDDVQNRIDREPEGIYKSRYEPPFFQLTPVIEILPVTLDKGAAIPERAYPTDAGLDLMSMEAVAVPPHDSMVVETGVHVGIPSGWAGLLVSKSGLMGNGIETTGLIDSSYTGSIKVVVFNHGGFPLFIKKGQKISQLVLIPVATPIVQVVDKLETTDRADRGFGSTGL